MLDKAYDPKPVEARRLKAWDEAGLSRRASTGNGEPFTIVIPPPNVTGALHLGHALNNTLQDVLIRWNRLLGRPVCWVPGTDHGGIATQNVMEKQLKAEGKTRHDLGRDKFLERMQEWTRECKKTILGQLRRLGCALDWEREAFTMDERRAAAVHECFKRLWDKGWIYRGERLVNWCVRCGTALSDIEVEREERRGRLYHVHYPLEDGSEGLVVATTRPETMFGDTAVAVHPEDKRWNRLIGKNVRLPLTDRRIPVIGDSSVESEFGTGALKITPAHDQADWEIGERHKLPAVKAIGPDGKLTEAAGPYRGLSRDKARDQVPLDLETQGFLRKTEDHKSAVGTCYRCGQVIEPLLSLQWFVKQGELAKEALKALDEGRFRIHPKSWEKSYRDWLSNIRDWCVSRQIWWGHRIPVWYKEGAQPRFAVSSPGAGWTQDPDVLDTWFSSALWPLSVFGWPEKTADLKRFYPTSVLVTGYEILYLWVARMQMTGLEFEGEVPFPDAVIHGIVRDKSGKKMSKSLGNVIDPLVMMDKYGTDALRFSLLRQAHPGRDIPFAEESLTGARNFVNKLWNSTRFVLMNLPSASSKPYALEGLSRDGLELADKWILSEYQKTLAEAKALMARFETAAAADLLYGFLWDKFCDWYVELAKVRLQGTDGKEKEAARAILVQTLSGTLKALHPFAPFATEELWLALKPFSGEAAGSILEAGLAEPGFDWSNPGAERDMAVVMEAITAIRSARAQLNVPPGLKIKALASGGAAETRALLQKHEAYLTSLARLERVEPASNGVPPPQSATAVAAGMKFFIPLAGLIDFDRERERLKKELAKAEAEAAKIAQKAENKSFLERAPKEEVELARAQHAAALARRAQLEETLKALS